MSSRPRPAVQTLDPETAHQRHQRVFAVSQSFAHGRQPRRPTTRHELDVLKERTRFLRSSDVDPSTLSWEDQLALKYEESLFKEYAIVNLKHHRAGAIALRWRTESEVLAGIAHLTCASLRCRYHLPTRGEADPESEEPLVETRLGEFEVPFGYVEDGEKKSALVKLVLCRECGKKLLKGRESAKGGRERVEEEEMEEKRGGSRRGGRSEERESEDDNYRPDLPPDIPRRRSSPTRRRSASPPRRRSASPRR